MRDRVLFVLARDALTRRPVAGALFFFRAGPSWALLGRRRRAEKSALRALLLPGIEFAIERRFELFEAGAQRAQARARLPRSLTCAHDIRHPGFRHAIERYIVRERLLAGTLAEYARHDPYRG